MAYFLSVSLVVVGVSVGVGVGVVGVGVGAQNLTRSSSTQIRSFDGDPAMKT